MNLNEIKKELRALRNPEKIAVYKNFHKTASGSYAEGEEFLGLTVPQIRKVAEDHHLLDFNSIKELLESRVHVIFESILFEFLPETSSLAPSCIRQDTS